MAVKFLVAMGCNVHVISTSPKKEALAKELGAQHFVVIADEEAKKAHAATLDFIIDTGSSSSVDLMRLDGLGSWSLHCLPTD